VTSYEYLQNLTFICQTQNKMQIQTKKISSCCTYLIAETPVLLLQLLITKRDAAVAIPLAKKNDDFVPIS